MRDAETAALAVVRQDRRLSRDERKALAWVIAELERGDHGLSCTEWAAFLELVDPDRYHYRLPEHSKCEA